MIHQTMLIHFGIPYIQSPFTTEEYHKKFMEGGLNE